MAPKKMWINRQLKFLKDTCNVVLGFRSHGESMKKEFNIAKLKTWEFLLDSSLDCQKPDATKYCDLYNLKSEKEGFLMDFCCDKENVSNGTKIIVSADENKKLKDYNFSCTSCLFSQSLACLINSIELAILHTNINTSSLLSHDIELYGLKFKNSEEDGNTRVFLGFKPEGSNTYDPLYLLCKYYGILRLIKVTKSHAAGKYTVGPGDVIYDFTRLMSVILIPIDDVYFQSAYTGASDNLYLSNKNSFDESFHKYSQKIGRAEGDRDVIYSEAKSPAKEKKASRGEMTELLFTYFNVKKLNEVKSEIFFASVLVILIALLYMKGGDTKLKKVSVL